MCTLKTRWRYKNDQTRSNIFELVGFDVQSGLNSEQWIVWFEQLIWNIFDILIFLNISNIFIGNILELVGFDVQSGLNSEQSGLNSSYGNILLLLAEDNLSIKDKVKSVRLQGYLKQAKDGYKQVIASWISFEWIQYFLFCEAIVVYVAGWYFGCLGCFLSLKKSVTTK